MAKTTKITISLPKPVLEWLQKGAEQRFMTAPEHIRAFIIDAYVQAQAVNGRLILPPKHGSRPVAARHNNAKARPTQSGYKGVYPYGKRWQAVISHDGRQERLGVYDTSEDAALAYDTAMVERAGGDVGAAVNAIATRAQTAVQADAPYVEKLRRGENLSELELAAWRRDTANIPAAPSSAMPVTLAMPVPTEHDAPMVPPVRRQLRRTPGPAIERPIVDLDDDPDSA